MTCDDRQVAVQVVGADRTPGNGALRIGGRPDGHGTPIHAMLDEPWILRRVLGAREIRAHARNSGTNNRTDLAGEPNFNDPPGEQPPRRHGAAIS